MTCAKTQEFLAENAVSTQEQWDARKVRQGPAEALALLSDVDELYAMRGKRVVRFDLRTERPDDETLLSCMLGPTGNLRAPTIRVGRTLLVGFEGETYRSVLG